MKHKSDFQPVFAGLLRRQTLPAPGRESKDNEPCRRKPEIRNLQPMKTTAKLICLILTSLLSCSSYYSYAQGRAGSSPCCPDTGGVKYLQSPDLTNGIDVNATFFPIDPADSFPWVLADDFPCTSSGPITDIDLGGSWLSYPVHYHS